MNGSQHKIVGVGFGLAATYQVVVANNDPTGIVILMTSVFGAMLPDIDHDKTQLGRRRKVFTEVSTKVANTLLILGLIVGAITLVLTLRGFIDTGVHPALLCVGIGGIIGIIIIKKLVANSRIFKWSIKHRGLMHTLVIPALLFVAINASDYCLYRYGIMGMLVGYLSHLIADCFTTEGCPILFPLSYENFGPRIVGTKDPKCTQLAYLLAIIPIAFMIWVYPNVIGIFDNLADTIKSFF